MHHAHTHSQDDAPSDPKEVEQQATSIDLGQEDFLDVGVPYTIIVYAENDIGPGENSSEISYTRTGAWVAWQRICCLCV